ncbi:MAG: DUF4918 domain-containing protein [Cyclobacteriaceae bacterium]|nr:MAG: DUF4918 domain-containing protein [Cyclobacteriaceae bacterium]
MIAEKILAFLKNLKPPRVPDGVEVMNPYTQPDVWKICETFYRKYYSDNNPRLLMLGINPGRFGGGTTGIPFTDPVKLQQYCGIPNTWQQRAELSADFVYRVIEQCGGPDVFYRKVYIGAVSPLGFTRSGKNLNYYDDKNLLESITGFCLQSLRRQLSFNLRTDCVICLGEGKNFAFLSQLNHEHGFFNEILSLPHPRFIMQYKRKQLGEYVTRYVALLS